MTNDTPTTHPDIDAFSRPGAATVAAAVHDLAFWHRYDSEVQACGDCLCDWPCPTAILLAHVQALTRERDALREGWLEDVDAVLERLAAVERERDGLREALETIARGVWIAPNSVESIVWLARKALAAPAATTKGE